MAYFIGSRELKDFYTGSRQVERLYQGAALLYERPSTELWTPSAFGSALGCWFDCTDSSKITLGTSNAVSRWTSVNSSSIYATPYNSTTSTFRAAGHDNFAPYIQFSLSSLSSNYIGSANPKTVWTVTGQPTISSNGAEGVSFGIVNSGDTRFYFGASVYGSQYHMYYGFGNLANQVAYCPATSPTGRAIISVVSHNSGLQVNAYLDGTLAVQATASSGTIGRNSNFLMGYTTVSRQPIKEAGYYNGVLSDADRQKLEGYLAHKYGTQNYLPAGHPYKENAPTT